jgi:hypothetical protein
MTDTRYNLVIGNMTEYEIEKAKREKRKREKEIEEAMSIGFLAGNMGANSSKRVCHLDILS